LNFFLSRLDFIILININIYHRIQWVLTLSEEEESLTEDLEVPNQATAILRVLSM